MTGKLVSREIIVFSRISVALEGKRLLYIQKNGHMLQQPIFRLRNGYKV